MRTCQSKTVGFESGTTEGFALSSGPAGTTVTNSAVRAHTGTRALAIAYDATSTLSRRAAAHLNLCGAPGVTNLIGSTVSAWVYVDGPALPDPATSGHSDVSIYLFTQSGSFYPNASAGDDPPVGTWFPLSVTVPATPAGGAASTGIDLQFYVNGTGTWSGTVYFDDLTITP